MSLREETEEEEKQEEKEEMLVWSTRVQQLSLSSQTSRSADLVESKRHADRDQR